MCHFNKMHCILTITQTCTANVKLYELDGKSGWAIVFSATGWCMNRDSRHSHHGFVLTAAFYAFNVLMKNVNFLFSNYFFYFGVVF